MSEILDTRGLICPLPVLKARKRLLQLPKGTMLTVLSDDIRAPDEFRLFCQESGFTLMNVVKEEDCAKISLSDNSA